ncbi:hypothetical protein RHECNPAF_4460034 [Rhizobium etli CNPAF512]|nr:hypothetical protein RHECNPAF_4460034 [Rhizobium etli CNPAF512]
MLRGSCPAGRRRAPGSGKTAIASGRSPGFRYLALPTCMKPSRILVNGHARSDENVVPPLKNARADILILREQHRRKLAAGGNRRRILETPDLEELQQLAARAVIVEASVLAHDLKQMFGRLVAPAFDVEDLGELQPRFVIVGIGGQFTLEGNGIAELARLLDLVELLQDRLDAGISSELLRQIGQCFARPLVLVCGDHAFGHSGKRLGILGIGLHDGAVKLRGLVKVAGGEQFRCFRQDGLDFGRLIGAGRPGDPIDELGDLTFRHRAHETVGRAAVDEGDDGGDRLDAKLTGNRGMVVDVHLDQPDSALGLVDNLLQDRCQLLARPAPGRPEIDQHRLFARFLDDVLAEIRRRRVGDVAAGRSRRCRLSAEASRCRHLISEGTVIGVVAAAHRYLPPRRSCRHHCSAKIVCQDVTFKTSGLCPVASMKRTRSPLAIDVVASLASG